MAYSEEILKKVKNFGALQYAPEKIVTILQPDDKETFLKDLADNESILYAIYHSGLQSGLYNQDIQVFQAGEIAIKKTQLEFEQLQRENSVYKELFGL